MKLVQLLAKELKEWPQGVTHLTQSEVDNEIYNALDGNKEDSVESLNNRFDASRRHSESPYPVVTRDQWQAEREKMNKPKWIRHRGGKCPVKAGTKVVTRYRDGVVSDWCMTRDQDTSEECLSSIWSHGGGDLDIMAYYVEETKDQEIEEVFPKHMAFGYASKEEMVAQIGEECQFAQAASAAENTNLGTLTYKIEIDATEATQQIDSLVAKWGQIESPLKWRDEIIELEAREEEFRREREKLIRKLESEGFKLIDYVAPVYGEQVIDLSDWRNWQTGDIVECLTAPAKHKGYYLSGSNYTIRKVDLDDEGTGCEISVYSEAEMSLWCPSSSFKFILRP